MKKFTIVTNNHSNHACNRLLSLNGEKYSTAANACERIFERLFDAIDQHIFECVDFAGDHDAYVEAAKKYIFDEMYASDDGVSVRVEEIEEEDDDTDDCLLLKKSNAQEIW